ncbi:MAG: glycosyltransferase [Nitrospira sp.]
MIRRICQLAGLWQVTESCDGRPKRVVFTIHDLGCGGAQRQLVLLLTHLDRTQWFPEVVVMDMTDAFFAPALDRLGIPIVQLQPHPILWSTVIWRLVIHLRKNPCHILHNWLPNSIHAGAVAGTIIGVPVIIASVRSEAPDCVAQKVEPWRRTMDRSTAKLITIFIGNSHAVCSTTRSWAHVPRSRMEMVYNGVARASIPDMTKTVREHLRGQMGIPPDVPAVGIIARLDEDKDHVTFLRVAQEVHTRRPDVQFAIIGDGPLRNDLSRMIDQWKMHEYVTMYGRSSDVSRMMQLLDVVALTSVSEGCPNVLLEAAELGVPVITTAAGGAAELVVDGETGFVVPCQDSRVMADRIIELLSNHTMRDSFIERARLRARSEFSPQKMVANFEHIYRRALARKAVLKPIESPLRVCFVMSQAYGVFRPRSDRVFGGAEVQVANLAKQLVQRGNCKVYVVTGEHQRKSMEDIDGVTVILDPFCAPSYASSASSNPSHPHLNNNSRSTIVEWGYRWLAWCPPPLRDLSRWLVRGGVKVKQMLLHVFPIDWCVRTQRNIRLLLQWIQLLRTIDADVYVTRCAGTTVGFMQLACSCIRRPFVYMVAHDMDVSGEYIATYPIEGKWFERGLRHADVVICQNETQAHLLFTQHGRHGCVIPSLCPFEISTDLDHTCRTSILWMARVDDWKQPELFVQLASRIPDQHFIMVAVASQVSPTQLDSLHKAAQRTPNLTIRPAVPLHETIKLFQKAAVFVNTSKVEGFPNTYMQAAASGTPIVSWAVNPDGMLERYAIGFCAGQDWLRFEQAVQRLCSDRVLRERMGQNGVDYVNHRHHPENITETYLTFFSELRAGKASREFRVYHGDRRKEEAGDAFVSSVKARS